MWQFLIGTMLIIHGLIVAAQSFGAFGWSSPVVNPPWLKWWPTALGQSWLLAGLGLEKSAATWFFGFLWLIAGVALVAAGLGVVGVFVSQVWWPTLAIGGAGLSLLLLFLYFHPFYAIGIGASVAILAAPLWIQWSTVAWVGM
jgi:hypothetical protein